MSGNLELRKWNKIRDICQYKIIILYKLSSDKVLNFHNMKLKTA